MGTKAAGLTAADIFKDPRTVAPRSAVALTHRRPTLSALLSAPTLKNTGSAQPLRLSTLEVGEVGVRSVS